MQLPFFKNHPRICVASALNKYLNYTKNIRGNTTDLFIALKSPFKAVCTQTISRWLKETLKKSGIDTTTFTGHSTRHASTSCANSKGIDIDTIRSTATWSEGSQIFARYYNRPIQSKESEFAQAVLQK